MLVAFGSTTERIIDAVIAASTAFPPFFKISIISLLSFAIVGVVNVKKNINIKFNNLIYGY